MISFASVIFLLPASISAFLRMISSRLALSAALSPLDEPPAEDPPAFVGVALLSSSRVSRLPLLGVNVISQGWSRPTLYPGIKFGAAVGWLAATVYVPVKGRPANTNSPFLFVLVLYLAFRSVRKTSMTASARGTF